MSENIDVINVCNSPGLNTTAINSFHWTRIQLVFAAVSVILINSIYFFRLDQVVGQFGDDAWYIVLARSIAEQGTYQLISSPIQGIQPVYPPLFPLLLAGILRVFSLKTEEFWLLKGLSIIAMNLVGLGTFIYYRKVKDYPLHISWLLSLMITIMPAFVFLATSTVMSECVFTFFQIWAVVYSEKALRNKTLRLTTILAMIGLCSAAFFTRSLGITLIVAVIIQLWRVVNWRYAMLFGIGFGIILTSWVLYCQQVYPNNDLKNNHGGSIVTTYLENLSYRTAGRSVTGRATANDYLLRVSNNFQTIAGRDILGILIPATLHDETRSGEEVFGLGGTVDKPIPFATQAVVISVILSFFLLIGFVRQCIHQITISEIVVVLTIICVITWPWATFRFILPIAPFMLSYWVQGIREVVIWVNKKINQDYDSYALVRISLICFTVFFLLEHIRYVRLLQTDQKSLVWVNANKYADETCSWMSKNLPEGSVVASTNPAKIFLSTGHLAVAGDLSIQSWSYWKESDVRYMAILAPNSKGMLDRTPEKYKTVYDTGTVPSLRVIDLGEPKTRDSWEEYEKSLVEYYLKQSRN